MKNRPKAPSLLLFPIILNRVSSYNRYQTNVWRPSGQNPCRESLRNLTRWANVIFHPTRQTARMGSLERLAEGGSAESVFLDKSCKS